MADVKTPDRRPVREQVGLEAENAVLGSLLIDPDIAPALFAEVKPEDFSFKENYAIFSAARSLFREKKPLDAVTVRDKLSLPKADAERYSNHLISLMETTPTSANWREYAALMREQSMLFKIQKLGGELMIAPTLDAARAIVAQLADVLSARRGVKAWNVNEMAASFLEYQGECAENPGAGVEYVRYGIQALDEGMYTEPGDVVVIGGYPSDGKTALALNLGWRMSAKWKVGFFSLETNRKKLRDRLMSHALPLDFTRIKRRTLSERDWETAAYGVAHALPGHDFTVVEAGNMSASDIQAISRAYGFQLIFVDYIQLITPETRYGANRAEQIATISRSMHAFAQDTKTTVFELAQLSRPDKTSGSSGNAAKPKFRDPNMSDLKESGQLEQDADAVLIVFRPEIDKPRRILKIAKNKEGVIGSFYLDFDAATQTFSLSADQSQRVMRDLSDAGRAVKARNRANAANEYAEQIPIPADYELPF